MKYKVLNERKGTSTYYAIYYKLAGKKLRQVCTESEVETLIRSMESLEIEVTKVTRNEVTTVEKEIEL